MNRTAAVLTSLTLLLAAGCGRAESTPAPPPAPTPAEDAIAAMPEPTPVAPKSAPVTSAPPKMHRVAHPVPKDHLRNVAKLASAVAPKPASDDNATAKTDAGEVAGCDHGDHGGHAHDPEHPPIDCPLAKAGVDAHHMKPFEDVEKYIAHLERPDRAVWQKPDEVVAALGLEGGETVYDVGAGSGYFSFRFAKAVPKGRVIAADTEAEMVRHVHHKAMTEGIENVTGKVISTDDPGVTADADLVFICDVLHHVEDRAAWMGKLVGEMKPGARLAIIEFKKEDLPVGPPAAMKMSREETVKLAKDAGLEVVSEDAELLPYQLLHVFRKP